VEGWDEAPVTIKRKEATLNGGQKKLGGRRESGKRSFITES